MDWKDKITCNPQVLMGKPTIKGTRISVAFLLDIFAEGWSKEKVLENYPQITEDDIRAVFAYSAARVGNEAIAPLKSKLEN
jgi:uncharacterized protein (DUF433 family)